MSPALRSGRWDVVDSHDGTAWDDRSHDFRFDRELIDVTTGFSHYGRAAAWQQVDEAGHLHCWVPDRRNPGRSTLPSLVGQWAWTGYDEDGERVGHVVYRCRWCRQVVVPGRRRIRPIPYRTYAPGLVNCRIDGRVVRPDLFEALVKRHQRRLAGASDRPASGFGRWELDHSELFRSGY